MSLKLKNALEVLRNKRDINREVFSVNWALCYLIMHYMNKLLLHSMSCFNVFPSLCTPRKVPYQTVLVEFMRLWRSDDLKHNSMLLGQTAFGDAGDVESEIFKNILFTQEKLQKLLELKMACPHQERHSSYTRSGFTDFHI